MTVSFELQVSVKAPIAYAAPVVAHAPAVVAHHAPLAAYHAPAYHAPYAYAAHASPYAVGHSYYH